jgi:hypothetical protein
LQERAGTGGGEIIQEAGNDGRRAVGKNMTEKYKRRMDAPWEKRQQRRRGSDKIDAMGKIRKGKG